MRGAAPFLCVEETLCVRNRTAPQEYLRRGGFGGGLGWRLTQAPTQPLRGLKGRGGFVAGFHDAWNRGEYNRGLWQSA
jgi:hypothetical protein